jgi:hypothetical protein
MDLGREQWISTKFLVKYGLPVTKVYRGGEQPWSAAVGRPPWFVWTMLTHGGELSQ